MKESKPVRPGFISGKITDRKLEGDNYLPQIKIMEIHCGGRKIMDKITFYEYLVCAFVE